MDNPNKQHQQADIFRLRRRFAKTAFAHILGILYFCGLIIVFGTEQMADNLQAVMGILITILAFLTGLMGHYGHQVHKHDMSERDND